MPGEYAECEIQGEPPEKKMILEVFLTGRQTDVLWMEKALKLGGRSFLSVPFKLLKEIKGLLQDRRKNLPPRASRLPRVGVYLEVRGYRVLVRNTLSRTSLLLERGEEVGTLQWLIKELAKDLEDLGGKEALARDRKRRRGGAAGASGSDGIDKDLDHVPPEIRLESCEDAVRKEVLEDLKQHRAIESVWWSKRKRSLIIVAHWPCSLGPLGTICKQKTFAIWDYNKKRNRILKGLEELAGPLTVEQEEALMNTLRALWKNCASRVLFCLEHPDHLGPRGPVHIEDSEDDDAMSAASSSSSGASSADGVADTAPAAPASPEL